MGIADRTYNIEGFEIVVGLAAVERLDKDWISIKFNVTCDPAPGQRSGTWSGAMFNNYFTDKSAFERDLDRTMRAAAQSLLPTLKGESRPAVHLWMASVANPNDSSRRVQLAASVMPRSPKTLCGREVADMLDLPAGESGGRKAFVQVLARRFFVELYPSSTILTPLLIGGDLIQKAAQGRKEPFTEISDLFVDEAVKAYQARQAAREHTVLLIGSYSEEGKRRLRRLEAEVVRRGYSPVLIEDFRGDEASLEVKFLSFALISKFVLYESSVPSGAIDELKISKDNGIVIAKLNEAGSDATTMQSHYERDCTHTKFFEYESGDLGSCVEEAVKWAETVCAQRAHSSADVR